MKVLFETIAHFVREHRFDEQAENIMRDRLAVLAADVSAWRKTKKATTREYRAALKDLPSILAALRRLERILREAAPSSRKHLQQITGGNLGFFLSAEALLGAGASADLL